MSSSYEIFVQISAGKRVVERGEVLLRQPPPQASGQIFKDDVKVFLHLGYLLYG
jgi:hypothetical protein